MKSNKKVMVYLDGKLVDEIPTENHEAMVDKIAKILTDIELDYEQELIFKPVSA